MLLTVDGDLTTKPEILREKGFNYEPLPAYVLCEKDERWPAGLGSIGIRSAVALWASLLISHNINSGVAALCRNECFPGRGAFSPKDKGQTNTTR